MQFPGTKFITIKTKWPARSLQLSDRNYVYHAGSSAVVHIQTDRRHVMSCPRETANRTCELIRRQTESSQQSAV